MRALLDTNIVIDALTGRQPFYEDASVIFDLAGSEYFKACLTANIVTDIYYLLHKTFGEQAIRKHLLNLFELFDILPVYGTDCKQALNSPIADFEDALQAVCAERSGIDYIITRDVKFIQECSIALTPALFIKNVAVNS